MNWSSERKTMSNSGLIIRRNERHEVSLPAKARVAFTHAEVIKLNKGAGGKDGWVDVQLIDFSRAGIGIISSTFFPRGAIIEIVVSDPESEDLEALIRCEMRVMRVQMTDRRPAYLIGGAFSNTDETVDTQITALMDRLNGEGDDHA